MANKQLVLAIFEDEAKADAAVDALKGWERTYPDARLQGIGVLVLDEHGKIKAHKVGSRSISKGAGIGVVLAMVTPPGLVAGLIVGGALGALHHKGLGLSGADRDRLGTELQGGKAAVGVLADAGLASGIQSIMQDLGGTPEVHDLDDAALEAVAAAAATEPEAAETETTA